MIQVRRFVSMQYQLGRLRSNRGQLSQQVFGFRIVPLPPAVSFAGEIATQPENFSK